MDMDVDDEPMRIVRNYQRHDARYLHLKRYTLGWICPHGMLCMSLVQTQHTLYKCSCMVHIHPYPPQQASICKATAALRDQPVKFLTILSHS